MLKNDYLCTHESELANMTTNKQFNSCKEGLDLEILREYCMELGEVFDKS